MKRSALLFFSLLVVSFSFSQSNIEKANTCFDKKDYPCAIDNYLIALEQKSYKEGQQYLVEYRIAKSYFEIDQREKAIGFYKKAVLSKPDLLSAYWGLGDSYYELDQFNSALENYRLGSEKATDPKDKEEFIWWMGNSYLGLKQPKMVIAQFSKIQSRAGFYIKADGYLGDAYFGLKKFDSALVFYKTYLSNLKPTDSTTKVIKTYIGKCYRETGKYAEAMEQQDAALAMDANYTEARWEKGILFANKKEYPSAIEQYKKALAGLPITDSSQHYTLCGNIAACNQNMGNYAEAVSWQQKRKNYSTNKYIECAKIATLQYAKLKQPKEAEKTCIEAINTYPLEKEALKIKATPDYVKLNNVAGIIALEKKDTAKADQYFQEALRLEKYNYEANAGAGKIAWARKKEDDYKKFYGTMYKSTYDTLLSTPKDIANVYGRAAYVEAYLSKYQPSTYKYNVENALKFDSLQRESLLLWPRVILAETYNVDSKKKACIAVLGKAIKAYTGDHELISNLYNCKAVLTDKADTAAIRGALETAVKVCPENMDPWDNLLKFYTSYDNAKGALMADKLIDILKKKKDNSSAAVAYVYKGDFLWRIEKKDDAKKAWQEALVWDANNATAKERVKM